MSYASAMHDRMLASLVIPCRVVAVDLAAAMVRVSDGSGWTSAWVRWHSQAAGKARHWRAPSLDEQGALISPSGDPAQGTFVPGLYGNAGPAPDNRDHVEVWRFDDGGSLVYDWQAKSYTIELPSGTVTVKVGASQAVLTGDAITAQSSSITAQADTITLTGAVTVNGTLMVTGDINGGGRIIDTAGNTANHKH
ncbi:phage baseplate assembly protein V [Pseudomonas mosselii]|uniref:phage baseplate assembly protein V n=1 Tax=Pseudomonas mosselii TaxID=78327 RepID=UPI0021D8900A|nr:phage baseplate assembly protein V [Pseudomonas mosselii]MCU9528645.1 phage baseplate assembly protein V [Pseudomonas mosselii]MCU9535046.1 phage baseplate assembly protein V [Pseudomonas mosselii]MCU9541443.1 phage baseplate assembly protein V [Pseudomonas mosselii]MCU9546781.1 phage baseplate assembly protein V [Pseudomonas mosselii]